MGLVEPDSQVPPFFYVEAPTNVVPDREREDAPDTGVTFNGTKREVRIQDVIDVMGRREPTVGLQPARPIVRPSSTWFQRPHARSGAGGQARSDSARMDQRVSDGDEQPDDAETRLR